MPQAQPAAAPQTPAPLREDERRLIKEAVARIFGQDAVVRNYGPRPSELRLHVEAVAVDRRRVDEFLGLIYLKIVRERIGVSFTRRGTRVSGNEKIAYRQGVVL